MLILKVYSNNDFLGYCDYLNNKEKCSSGIDFLYFDMLLKKHGGKRNGGNVLFSMPADRS